MVCATCALPLLAGARFCAGCGTAAPAPCTSCSGVLPPGARFCPACGREVGAPTTPAVGAGTTAPVAQRRVVSVLFCDLVGFTGLAARRDPEEVRELLTAYFDRARQIVARYGGTIEKFIGDAVMAVWGVPTAHEDDAERSVRAGLDLVDAVARLGEDLDAPALASRVGIVTDEVAVTVGAVGQGMVAGDPVNVAARVQAAATPGSVWCDHATARLVASIFDVRDRGEHDLKGKTEPVRLHVVAGASPTTTTGLDRSDVPLVGRGRDLALLQQLFHAAEEERRPRMAVVAGTAGIGKSRLARELEAYVEGLPHAVLWHSGRCVSYGDGVAFSALSATVRVRAGIPDDAEPAEARERLHAVLCDVVQDVAERRWMEAHLLRLLGLAPEGEELVDVGRDDRFAAWSLWFERISERHQAPVVWIVEDAHHADAGFLDFVGHLVSRGRFPGFVVVLARPELLDGRPRLATSGRTAVLNLERMTPEQLRSLLDELVDGLPDAVAELLVRRSEGLPLFAVETVRALHDQDLLEPTGQPQRPPLRWRPTVDPAAVESMRAPTSLQLLVASRLDLLTAAPRRVVDAAAVLGQTFTVAGLCALTGADPHEVEAQVADLCTRELFVRVTDRLSADHGRIAFVQPTVRTVAYEGQARRDRAHLHLAAVNHLEGLPGARGELGAVIVQHLHDAYTLLPAADPRRGALGERLVAWLATAMAHAAEMGAAQEVLHLGDQLLARADGLTTAAVRARIAMAEAATDLAHLDVVVDVLEPVLAEPAPVTATPDDRARAAALASRAHGLRGDVAAQGAALRSFTGPDGLEGVGPGAAAILCMQAMQWHETCADWSSALVWRDLMSTHAERSGQPPVVAVTLSAAAQSVSLRGQHLMARELRRLAVDYARSHLLTAQLTHSLLVALAFGIADDVQQAVAIGEEAVATATRAGNRPLLEQIVSNQVLALRLAGRWTELDALAGSHPDLEDHVADMMARVQRALAAETRGRPAEALAHLDAPVREGLDGYDRLWLDAIHALRCHLEGDHAEALDRAERLCGLALHHCGLVDDYPHHLTMVAPWFLAAGEHDRLRALLAPTLHETGLTPLLQAQALWLRAALEDADPSSVVEDQAVDALFEQAVEALEAVGAATDLARAEAARRARAARRRPSVP
ncbi:adenylate/guanylate cyclase domain-containing protein [Nocardioides zeae]|uniref:Class 3 adenylate cyclase n=1 Tax=Nocardioides zeae TaxID=1457234 RepID=A0AAJ1X3B2_9ACTN|nr:adenylate/guanylate cyclase domain-containing protein [Nocardioides zeae]MDQ1106686.1 class 3 adenylate cyclase [Nocardioides zeae]